MGIRFFGSSKRTGDKSFVRNKHFERQSTKNDFREHRYMSLPGSQPSLFVKYFKEGNTYGT